jgi:hypothetical protein
VWKAEALSPQKRNQHLDFQGLYGGKNIKEIKKTEAQEKR